jgi:hypothetical protein
MQIGPTSALRGFLILLFALGLAALLDAEGLRKQAQIQPQGVERRAAMRLTEPLVSVSRALHLTTPRHSLQVAIGREHEDEIDTQVHLTLPPPAGPLPQPRRRRPHTPAQPAKPVFTSTHQLRVWVAGDSLAQVPGDGLARVAPDSVDVVAIESRLSTGLARPDLYNWYTRFNQVIAAMKPQVVVLSFGADDAHDFMAGVPGGRSVGTFGSPAWIAEYRRRVDGVTREFLAAGIRTIWLGLPIPDGPGFRRSFPVVNSILESVARKHAPLAQYVDTWHLLDSAHGKYTAYLRVGGKLTLMRLPDGVHYTDAAGDLVARDVLDELRRAYVLR